MVAHKTEQPSLRIRRITVRDVPTVVFIAKECAFGDPKAPKTNPELAWSEESFFKEVYNTRSVTLVAELGDEVVGYLCASVVIDECHIQNIAVRPKHRGNGIGHALIEQLLLKLRQRDLKRAFLELRRGNHVAIRLYESMGFKVVALRKDYYVNPTEDGLIMVKTL